jgi:hypothetical protein
MPNLIGTTGHFGLNTFFADNGLEDGYPTRLYFPADVHQMTAIVNEVFWDMGLRFVFSTRSKVPNILKEGSQEHYFGGDYKFMPGKDEVSTLEIWVCVVVDSSDLISLPSLFAEVKLER